MFSLFNNTAEIFEVKSLLLVNSRSCSSSLKNLHIKKLLITLRNLVSFSLVSDFVMFLLLEL